MLSFYVEMLSFSSIWSSFTWSVLAACSNLESVFSSAAWAIQVFLGHSWRESTDKLSGIAIAPEGNIVFFSGLTVSSTGLL